MITEHGIAALAKAFILVGTLTCSPAPLPAVELVFDNVPPVASHDKGHAELGSFQSSTQFSRGSKETFLTSGITESNISTFFNISFNRETDRQNGESCISIKDLKITVSYAPLVHIANSYKQGSCFYNITWLHELQHVNTDILTIKEFLPLYQKTVENTLLSIKTGKIVRAENVEKTQDDIAEKIKAALNWATEQMNTVRGQRQQMIDTRQEYLRLSNACPNEPLR